MDGYCAPRYVGDTHCGHDNKDGTIFAFFLVSVRCFFFKLFVFLALQGVICCPLTCCFFLTSSRTPSHVTSLVSGVVIGNKS
jgi:hypothetical protein